MVMKADVRITRDRLSSVLAGVKRATRKQVRIGIPYDHTARPGDIGISNAMIGHINEFGSPTQNIPARPHLIPGVLAARTRVTDILKKGLIDGVFLAQDDVVLDKAMHAAGLVAVSSVKTTITSRLTPALAEYTLDKRQERGRTGDLPLIDTGQYLNALTYVVRTAGPQNAQP